MVRYGCDKESVRNPGRFLLLWVDSDDSLYFNMRIISLVWGIVELRMSNPISNVQ